MSVAMIGAFWNGIRKEKDKSVNDVTMYQEMIGSLLYPFLRKRLEIIPAELILACSQIPPTSFCFQIAERI